MAMRILGYVICGLGVIIYLFFRKYTGTLIPNPFLFWLLGIAIMAGGAFLIRFSYKKAKEDTDDKIRTAIAKFKKTNIAVDVSLVNCEILRNDYVNEVLRNTSRARAWDAMVDETRNTKRATVNQSVLVIDKEINGKKHRFYSQTLNIEYHTLMFKMDIQKQTKLYYNQYNPEEYYLDMEFLQHEN